VGLGVETPVGINNRAGLTAIAYRVGTHAQFKASMLAALSSAGHPALGALQTREDDDFSIALLDAWATVADVLTFYQERIANESYLRTATERLSLIEMARLIGYQPRPGVAASTYLAFTIEDAPGAPGRATIDIGTKAQSIPGPGEQAQMFETVEKIEARAAWNTIKPQLTKRHPVEGDADTFYFEGVATGLKKGDGVLVTPYGLDSYFRQIAEVMVEGPQQRTKVLLQPLPAGTSSTYTAIFTGYPPGAPLSAVAQSLLGQTISEADLQAAATAGNFQVSELFAHLTAARQPSPRLLAMRQRAAIFGHNAPKWSTLPVNLRIGEYGADPNEGPSSSPKLVFREGPYRGRSDTWVENVLKDYPGVADDEKNIYLDNVYSTIAKGSFVVLKDSPDAKAYKVIEATEVSHSDFTLNAKVSRLTLESRSYWDRFRIRKTSVFAQSEELALARFPIDDPIAGSVIDLDNLVEGLSEGQSIVVCGEPEQERGKRVCEAMVIAKVEHLLTREGFTRITLSAELSQAYVRDTVTINANASRATHGETAQEVLGSGDASQAYQRFTLRQPPLTHTSAATASGTASSLQIRVNDLLWHEAPSLYGHGPDERIFVTRLGDDGKTTVVFGDGRTGARLPSGQENVRAIYRKGIGRGGLVKAEQISLLLTRPLGVKGVINPIASSGADDAETLDDARTNAPLTVMTLDRIVSLQDYEDFARAYAGIAKAHATWTWSGQVRGVFVTVAGPDGAEVKPDSDLYKNLLAAMQQSGDPHVPLRVQTYRPAFFRLAANVKVHPDYLPDKVLAAVEQALRAQFSFAARQFGQPVALSEVIAVMQSVKGVVAVDVDKLYRFDDTSAGLKALLPAAAPQAGDKGTVAAAELLTLDPSPLHDLGVMP
jgi:predicted phage baseplate assembly protein